MLGKWDLFCGKRTLLVTRTQMSDVGPMPWGWWGTLIFYSYVGSGPACRGSLHDATSQCVYVIKGCVCCCT